MVNTVLRKRPNIIQRFFRGIGEISVLRSRNYQVSGFYVPYVLDSNRVDYQLARSLYTNTNDKYKLGAGFAKPIINSTAGFMGTPHFSHSHPEADQELETAFSRWTSKMLRINRNALRDGDVFARIVLKKDPFNSKESIFDLYLIPPEWVIPVPDPINGGWLEVVIRTPCKITDRDGRVVYDYVVTETITKDLRKIEVDGRAPEEIRQQIAGVERNNWGFIPIVHFRNEPEEYQIYGGSDLEPVEPFLKAYHDVMLFSVQGSKLFSRPKAKFKLADVDKFLNDNFSPEEIKSKRLKFADKEIFLLEDKDDAEFITADSGLEGITTLLKFIYFCIVDVSETPEFAFGTAVQSSKASVSEQMVPFTRKIRRKRGMFEEPYGELASMYLAMWAQMNNVRLDSYQVDIGWEEVSPKSDKEVADTIKTLVDGLATGMESGILSVDAASEFLREFVPSMLPWLDPDADDDERRRVARTFSLIQRLRDGQGLDENEIDEGNENSDVTAFENENQNGEENSEENEEEHGVEV